MNANNHVGISLAYHVITCHKPLFCRDPRRLLTEENRVLSRMELDVWPYLRGKEDERHLA